MTYTFYYDVEYLTAFAAIHAISGAAVVEYYGLDMRANDTRAWCIAVNLKKEALAEAVAQYLEAHGLGTLYEDWINGGCK